MAGPERKSIQRSFFARPAGRWLLLGIGVLLIGVACWIGIIRFGTVHPVTISNRSDADCEVLVYVNDVRLSAKVKPGEITKLGGGLFSATVSSLEVRQQYWSEATLPETIWKVTPGKTVFVTVRTWGPRRVMWELVDDQ